MSTQDAFCSDPRLVAVYDLINARSRDFDHYAARLGDTALAVLDLGCGTGSFALRLAGLGHRVMGLDPATEMIAYARAKSGAEQVDWRVGFLHESELDRKFDAIVMTGHAFQCLIDDADILTLLRAVACHLKPNGRFLFETRDARARAWERWMPEFAAPPLALPQGGNVRVEHEVTEVALPLVHFEERYEFSESGKTLRSTSTLRFTDAAELQCFAAQAGLRVTSIIGDWDGALKGPELILEMVPL